MLQINKNEQYNYKGNDYKVIDTEQKFKDPKTGEWICLISYSPVLDPEKIYHRTFENFLSKFIKIQK